MPEDIKIFSGTSNIELAEKISQELNIPLGKSQVKRFSDGEVLFRVYENVRGRDCFIIQSTSPPVNEHLMELLIMIDTLKRASADRITAVIPYYGYGRQDRKVEPRVPITAKLVANLLTAAGANRILTVDLHAGQIQGFFDIPVDHLYGAPVFMEYLKSHISEKVVVVAPDAGGVERARHFSERISGELAIIDKRRPTANEAEVMHVIGDVSGKVAIVIDDLVDTGKTIVNIAEALIRNKATKVIAACTHPVLSGDAVRRIQNSQISELLVTDSIPLREKTDKIIVLTISKLLAEAIKRIHNNESVSALFE